MGYTVGLGLGNCRLTIPGPAGSVGSGDMVNTGLVKVGDHPELHTSRCAGSACSAGAKEVTAFTGAKTLAEKGGEKPTQRHLPGSVRQHAAWKTRTSTGFVWPDVPLGDRCSSPAAVRSFSRVTESPDPTDGDLGHGPGSLLGDASSPRLPAGTQVRSTGSSADPHCIPQVRRLPRSGWRDLLLAWRRLHPSSNTKKSCQDPCGESPWDTAGQARLAPSPLCSLPPRSTSTGLICDAKIIPRDLGAHFI